ncbi:MAG: DUF2336 domain-containing protein, partial [Caulobacteraceae bacterium]|nr:DUF2336 domain-containing protein [Caulobacteraceae bacterium]
MLSSEAAIAPPPPSRARAALLKRLADVVCLPSSRVNAFERSMISDLLVEMLRESEVQDRVRVGRRLCNLVDVPPVLLRLMLRDAIEVAGPLLETSTALTDADLVDCARHASAEHRRLIAMRRGIGELVCQAIVEPLEAPVIEVLLRNSEARLGADSLEVLVAETRAAPRLAPLLLRRPELRPSHAYVLFWWAGTEARTTILQRFAVSREVLQEAAGDV